jgi:hypothetical protein
MNIGNGRQREHALYHYKNPRTALKKKDGGSYEPLIRTPFHTGQNRKQNPMYNSIDLDRGKCVRSGPCLK